MSGSKKVVAVLFGGKSVEHDVSILTGLQFLEALDPDSFEGLPVYIDPQGTWWTGSALTKRSFYPLNEAGKVNLKKITIAEGQSASSRPHFASEERGLIGKKSGTIPFDICVPAVHGTWGEDGILQGLLESHNIPYAGCGVLASSATINKSFTKHVLRASGVSVLPDATIPRPAHDKPLTIEDVKKTIAQTMQDIDYPFFVKPRQLGSSIGVQKVANDDELLAALVAIFRIDYAAIIEPFVANLVEYNIAASAAFGDLRLSAIERPRKESEFLNFKDKYLAGGSSGPKLDEAPSEGMVSLSREINPKDLPESMRETVESAARTAFTALDLGGSVRIDFLSNSNTNEIWLNEINTIPGSFAFYLWQHAAPPVSFTELTSAMIAEGFKNHRRRQNETAASAGGSSIFARG